MSCVSALSTVAGAGSARQSSDAGGWRLLPLAVERSNAVGTTASGVKEPRVTIGAATGQLCIHHGTRVLELATTVSGMRGKQGAGA
jgi:hypothetical protein